MQEIFLKLRVEMDPADPAPRPEDGIKDVK
jgi:hypothetical protein